MKEKLYETSTIKAMQKLVHANAIEHGWWDCKTCDGAGTLSGSRHKLDVIKVECPTCAGLGKHRAEAESLALIHAEVSEALEHVRSPEGDHLCDKCNGQGIHDRMITGSCAKCGGSGEALCGSRYGEELADVIIRVFDEAEFRGIDLGNVIAKKHQYNLSRPFKHGKKF